MNLFKRLNESVFTELDYAEGLKALSPYITELNDDFILVQGLSLDQLKYF